MDVFVLPKALKGLIARFEQAGKHAYAVGGCVRNWLMGVPPADFDIATDALPEETAAIFSDCRVIPTGIRHGTLTVIYEDIRTEITTFRRECGYSDRRRPDSVFFTDSAKEDAARRDFTVNAMFYNPRQGVLDFYGGRKDLESRLLKAVGEPQRRFNEDPLRILRGMRFAARLDFAVEESTAKAMKELACLVGGLAAERVLAELKQFFAAPRVDRISEEFSAVFRGIFGFTAPIPKVDGFLPAQRLAVFLAEYGGSVEGALGCAAVLKPDKETLVAVKAAARAMYGPWEANNVGLARAAAAYGFENAALMCVVAKSKGRFVVPDYRERLALLKRGVLPLHVKDLSIKVEKIGVRGAALGKVLDALYDYAHNEEKYSAAALEVKAVELAELIKKEVKQQ